MRYSLLPPAAVLVGALALGCAEQQSPSAPVPQSPAIAPVPVPQSPAIAPVVRWPNEVNLIGAGDIASCFNNGDEATAKLLDTLRGSVFTAGDNAYREGTASQYANCYNPTWGRHKARTRPSPGNHDYIASGGAPYYAYFGSLAGSTGRGYYSYTRGSWHVVSLNSNLSMRPGSPQYTWLQNDLAASTAQCTLAYLAPPAVRQRHPSRRLDRLEATLEPALRGRR
jgi:acid phosphatase type 7